MLAPPPGTRGPIPRHTPALLDALQLLGCTWTLLPWGKLQVRESYWTKVSGRLRVIFQARRLLKLQEFDVVIIRTAHDWATLSRDIPLLCAVRRLSPHLVLQFHGCDVDQLLDPGKNVFKLFNRVLLSLSDGNLVLSSQERQQWKVFYPKGRFHLVSNPFAIPEFSPPVLSRTNKDDIPSLLYVGRLVRKKGLFELIEAVEIISERIKFKLVLVGDGPAQDSLKAEVRKRGLQERVSFPGYLEGEDLWNCYASASVFTLPSWTEGFPYTIAEAMYAGLPIVTTNIRGMADHLESGINALLVEPKSPSDLSVALEKILSDKELRSRMKESNQEAVRRFDPAVVAEQYLCVLQSICEEG